MGLEARCAARFGSRRSVGKVLLETNELVFRGNFRVVVPLRQIQSATVRSGELSLKYGDQTAVLELGDAADKWASKILHPKSLLEKLGVRAGMKIKVVGITEAQFPEQLRSVVGPTPATGSEKVDLVFLGADSRADLARLGELEQRIKPDGAIWVIRPKGRADIREMDVLQAGRAVGLVDVKVASFSSGHTAEKFVIPLSRRTVERGRSGPVTSSKRRAKEAPR